MSLIDIKIYTTKFFCVSSVIFLKPNSYTILNVLIHFKKEKAWQKNYCHPEGSHENAWVQGSEDYLSLPSFSRCLFFCIRKIEHRLFWYR